MFQKAIFINVARGDIVDNDSLGLNNIYSVIINTIVNIYTMSCETGSDSKHKAYI